MKDPFRAALIALPDQLDTAPSVLGGDLPPGGRLLVGGVGGSAAAGDFLDLLLGSDRETRVLRDAVLPARPRSDDRLIVLSYSGGTEESLSLWREAARCGMPRGAVGSGGTLLEWAREEGCPRVVLPAGLAPRNALGHLLRGAAALVGEAGADWESAARHLRAVRDRAESPEGPAGGVGRVLSVSLPVILCGDPESLAAARRWAASLAENAKVSALIWSLPEAAHNLIMAAGQGAPRRGELALVALGEPRRTDARRRWEAVLESLAEHGTKPLLAEEPHPEPWVHALGLAYFGDWVSVHLAECLGVDPAPLLLMDEVKRRLASGKESAS